VANGPGIGVDLIVIASNKALVTEEVNVPVIGASDILLRCNMLEAVSLIPASREDIERDLATNGKAVFRRINKASTMAIRCQALRTYVSP